MGKSVRSRVCYSMHYRDLNGQECTFQSVLEHAIQEPQWARVYVPECVRACITGTPMVKSVRSRVCQSMHYRDLNGQECTFQSVL